MRQAMAVRSVVSVARECRWMTSSLCLATSSVAAAAVSGEASEGLADLAVAVHSNAGIAAVTFV